MAPRKKATPAVDTTETIETKAAASESVAIDAAAETTPVKKTRTRKTAAKAAETTAAEEIKTTKTTKKTAAKKADEPKAAKTTTRKTAAKKAVEAETAAPAPKAEIFIEYGGAQVSVDEIITNARKIVGSNRDIKVYVQPDTSKAYIAFDGESVAMDVFFCK